MSNDSASRAEIARLQAENSALRAAAQEVIPILLEAQNAWDLLGEEHRGKPRQEIFESNGTEMFAARMKLTRALKGPQP